MPVLALRVALPKDCDPGDVDWAYAKLKSLQEDMKARGATNTQVEVDHFVHTKLPANDKT